MHAEGRNAPRVFLSMTLSLLTVACCLERCVLPRRSVISKATKRLGRRDK